MYLHPDKHIVGVHHTETALLLEHCNLLRINHSHTRLPLYCALISNSTKTVMPVRLYWLM
jgi:hypothetical protein